MALCAGDAAFTGGRIGVPVPGVELKVAPVGDQMEGRLRGPNITPGYWANPELTRAAFDEEGYYKLGDALAFFDPQDPSKGFAFQGRISEDFKLSTGTFVRVGAVRTKLLAHFGNLVTTSSSPGHDRAFVWRSRVSERRDVPSSSRASGARVQPDSSSRTRASWDGSRTASSRSRRCIRPAPRRSFARFFSRTPPAIDAQETTEKGSVNQKAVLARRAALVAQLYGDAGPGILIDITNRTVSQ